MSIELLLPESYTSDSLVDYFNKNIIDLMGAMNTDISYLDSRATIDNSYVTTVEVEDNFIFVWYKLQYSIYCWDEDLNIEDETEEECIEGTINGGKVVFPKFIPQEKPHTLDEF